MRDPGQSHTLSLFAEKTAIMNVVEPTQNQGHTNFLEVSHGLEEMFSTTVFSLFVVFSFKSHA